MKLTMFREDTRPDGTLGPVSMRRVVAFLSFFAAVALGTLALPYAVNGWYVFLPAACFALLSFVLLVCTTVTDVATLISAARSATGGYN